MGFAISRERDHHTFVHHSQVSTIFFLFFLIRQKVDFFRQKRDPTPFLPASASLTLSLTHPSNLVFLVIFVVCVISN
jgi:hypothetical protein